MLPPNPAYATIVGDLAIFSVDFCILGYMLNVLHISTAGLFDLLTSIIPTKFEVDITIHCRVIAFLSANTSRDLVTLTFDLLILNS